MRILLITNLITQWVVIGIILWRTTLRGRLEWQWSTTFFGKTRCGFYITLWEKSLQLHETMSGKAIFSFQWRNPKTVVDYPYIKNAKVWAMPTFLRALQP